MNTIGEKIALFRKHNNLKQDELADKINISRQSLINYETGKRQIPIDVLKNISKVLDIAIETFFYDDMKPTPASKNSKKIPIYSNASAGFGKFGEEDPLEWIELPISLLKNADFATFIEGDSMEPKIHNFDLALVKSTNFLENGDIGIFNLNDNILCKKFSHNPLERKVILKSINSSYKPIEVTNEDSFIIVGKVVANIQYNI